MSPCSAFEQADRERGRSGTVVAAAEATPLLWKPVAWRETEHYPRWVPYPVRDAPLPREGAQARLDEHPTKTYVAIRVESGAVSALVWLMLLGQADE